MRAAMPSPASIRVARKWVVGVAFALVGASLLIAWAATSSARRAPEWWRSTSLDDPATRAVGEEVENGVVSHLYLARPASSEGASDPWTLALKAGDANAWLNTRLRSWLAGADERFEWPEDIRDVQVDFDEGRVRVGARVRATGGERVFSATIRPELRDDGSLWTPAERLHIGRLPIPAGWVLDNASSSESELLPTELVMLPETSHLLDAFEGVQPLRANPSIDLGDGRRVRILAIRSRDGWLEVTCRTEWDVQHE